MNVHDYSDTITVDCCRGIVQMVQAATILSVPKPSISQRLQIKEDTVEPSVPAREFNLKAYTAITGHNDPTCLGLEPRLADHRSQAARTATLPTAPPRQASESSLLIFIFTGVRLVLMALISHLLKCARC